jgi:hypothetical protein
MNLNFQENILTDFGVSLETFIHKVCREQVKMFIKDTLHTLNNQLVIPFLIAQK